MGDKNLETIDKKENVDLDAIFVKGAREHNLKNIDVSIPRNKFVVITGLSGSGKSSLAFDTIFAEGQRRYIESLSTYARQFLGQTEKPDVDYIEGLSPAISIDQKAVSKNPRSTVGTVTEIYDYLRVLFARIGRAHCPIDGKPIQQYSIDEISKLIIESFKGQKVAIYAPVVRGRKGDYSSLFEKYKDKGYEDVTVDGGNFDLSEPKHLQRYKKHNISIKIDELNITDIGSDADKKLRLNEALEVATGEAEGLVVIKSDKEEISFSTKFSCPDGHIFEELEPRLFSFNSPYGACKVCGGIGYNQEVDPSLVIPDLNKTIDQGAILPWSFSPFNYYGSIIKSVAKALNIKTNVSIKNLSQSVIDNFLYGWGDEYLPVTYYSKGRARNFVMKFKGIIDLLESRYEKTDSNMVKEEITKYMSRMTCETCKGKRLKDEALSVEVSGITIDKLVGMPIKNTLEFFENLKLNQNDQIVAERLIKEINNRLRFLVNVGLGYLTLDRYANSLSGGETQRIRLASQIGSGLMGVLYILDEPSIGLHQKDNQRLLETLKHLRDLGNTVIVIEHDEETIRSADHIVDVGPGAGENGGKIIAQGNLRQIIASDKSLTGAYLRGDKQIEIPKQRRKITGEYITIIGVRENNLKNVKVRFPVSHFIAVTGVSGSGKSTLVNEVLYKGLAREISQGWQKPGKYERIEGKENIDKIIDIDQSPIGRTPRSNPATYTKAFDVIRELFVAVPDSRLRGYKPGRFSFNVSSSVGGGRCEKCRGDGMLKVEMHFLPDVYVPCDACYGKRYNHETLQVKYKNKNISDVLDMTVDQAAQFFENIPKLSDKLKVLQDVGLGYIKLGQSATTLSGGEAQRIKLSAELSKRATGKTLYILDEPTTGLHFDDVKKLLAVLNRLVDQGNTVVVIEHNLDVIKSSDYIIDLGPEGGEDGGRIVTAGTPEMVAGIDNSYTGRFLKEVLKDG
jgi:excinuclease ABC subunit A